VVNDLLERALDARRRKKAQDRERRWKAGYGALAAMGGVSIAAPDVFRQLEHESSALRSQVGRNTLEHGLLQRVDRGVA